jgi:hypothetical protein
MTTGALGNAFLWKPRFLRYGYFTSRVRDLEWRHLWMIAA